MRLTGSRAYYRPSPPKMPPGLVELMEGLTKEVLKHNPSDIYGFCAGHVQQLLEKRDGPSLKKSLSLEEKIVRAKEKVRQRAEKRRQEFDSEMLLQQQSNDATNNDVKNDLMLQLPQLAPAQESYVPDKDNSTSLQNQIAHNVLKVPVHHEHALEDSSEMEISHSYRLDVSTPSDDLNKSNEIDMETKVSINEENDVNVKDANEKQYEMSKNLVIPEPTHESIENKTEQTINSEKVSDSEVTNKEMKEPICPIQVDINSEPSKENEETKNVKEEFVLEYLNIIETHQQSSPVDSITLNQAVTTDSAESISNTNTGTDDVLVKEDKETDKMTGEDHAMQISHSEVKNDISESHDEVDVSGLNNTVSEDRQPPLDSEAMQESNSTEQATDNVVNVHSKNIGVDNTGDVQLLSHTKDLQQSNDTSNSTEPKADINDAQVSNNIAETLSEIDPNIVHESKESLQTNDNKLSEKENSNASNSQITENDVYKEKVNHENKNLNVHDIQVSHKMELTEPMKSTVSESEPQLDLPATGVDGDVSTLVTENMANDANEILDLKKDTSQTKDTAPSLISQDDKESTELEKISSDSEGLQGKPDAADNDIDSIANLSSAPTQNIKAKYNGNETSDNFGEIIRNSNKDTSNMDLETAAITIQKVFRNFLFKSRGSTFEDTPNDESNDEDDKNKEDCDFPIANSINIDRRSHGITRMDTVLQTVNEEKSLSISDDSSTLSSAATIIQAHVRGFLVRNKLNSNKTVSTNSLAASNSNEPSVTSLEADNDQNKNKTILNIHIVPEGENYLSRDESFITSMDLSLDSPPSSINLHPLGYDISERRKQLKREDAIQSTSPPSNNSGKLSDDLDFDSVKELSLIDNVLVADYLIDDDRPAKEHLGIENDKNTPIENGTSKTGTNSTETLTENTEINIDDLETRLKQKRKSLTKMSSDEMDVVSPFLSNEDSPSSRLMHSGEFHDAVLPTRVSRSDTSVVSGE